MSIPRAPRSAFALFELVVVVTMTMTLISLLLPKVIDGRDTARRPAAQDANTHCVLASKSRLMSSHFSLHSQTPATFIRDAHHRAH